MKYSLAKQGRIFIIRLEDGEVVHETIEQFAKDHSINAASMIILGGADDGSKLVVGPEQDRTIPVNPMEYVLNHVHEVAGTGTLFPNEKGDPVLHMHIACGRNGESVTGCVRNGVKVWHVMEVVLFELLDTVGSRVLDEKTGFGLLEP